VRTDDREADLVGEMHVEVCGCDRAEAAAAVFRQRGLKTPLNCHGSRGESPWDGGEINPRMVMSLAPKFDEQLSDLMGPKKRLSANFMNDE
jgi:hypothetical protein